MSRGKQYVIQFRSGFFIHIGERVGVGVQSDVHVNSIYFYHSDMIVVKFGAFDMVGSCRPGYEIPASAPGGLPENGTGRCVFL